MKEKLSIKTITSMKFIWNVRGFYKTVITTKSGKEYCLEGGQDSIKFKEGYITGKFWPREYDKDDAKH